MVAVWRAAENTSKTALALLSASLDAKLGSLSPPFLQPSQQSPSPALPAHTCLASSRVGASTMTEGGRPWVRLVRAPSPLVPASRSTIGSTKARVFPQPVRARPTKSLPASSGVRHCAWMSNRDSMPLPRSRLFTGSDSSKLSRARGLATTAGAASSTAAAGDAGAAASAGASLPSPSLVLAFLLFFTFFSGTTGVPAGRGTAIQQGCAMQVAELAMHVPARTCVVLCRLALLLLLLLLCSSLLGLADLWWLRHE